MVDLLVARGIGDAGVLRAMANVRRHLFIPADHLRNTEPYGDFPCDIGSEQTISQPYIVALMLEKLCLHPGDRVLEIGTGSGYQSAVLLEMGMRVFTVERIPALYFHAEGVLDPAVKRKMGDGYLGWPEMAPFNGIVLSCAPPSIPSLLVEQLENGGRMILPLGGIYQRLVMIHKENEAVSFKEDIPVRFVPMISGPVGEK